MADRHREGGASVFLPGRAQLCLSFGIDIAQFNCCSAAKFLPFLPLLIVLSVKKEYNPSFERKSF
jgi:hypothetical protein